MSLPHSARLIARVEEGQPAGALAGWLSEQFFEGRAAPIIVSDALRMKRFTSFRAALVAAAALAALSAPAGAQRAAFARAAPAIAPRLEAALPGPFAALPGDELVEPRRVSARRSTPASAGFLGYINTAGVRPLHPDFGGDARRTASRSTGSRTRRRRRTAEEDGPVPVTVARATASTTRPTELSVLPDPRRGHHTAALDRGRRTRATWICRATSDRHMLIVDRDNRHLYELYNVFYDGSTVAAPVSGAFFDLTTNDRRPETWTSADAAGLAILPGLVRYDEVYGDGRDPARVPRHGAGDQRLRLPGVAPPGSKDPRALPMGARLRLKAGVEISGLDPESSGSSGRCKRYGLIVADNGSDMYVAGTWDDRWDNDILNPALGQLSADDFEVIELGWQPPLAAALSVDARPGWIVEPERGAGAGRVRDRRAVVGERGRPGGDALGRGLGFHGARRRDVHDRRRDRELRLTGGGRSRELLRGGRKLLPAGGLGPRFPPDPPLGHGRHRKGKPDGGEDLGAPRRRELLGRRARERLLPGDREPLPQRRDRRLQRRGVLPVRAR